MVRKCPSCGGELVVREYECKRCGTRIIGRFEQSRILRLSDETLKFLEVFLLKEGNISAVCEELGISYPKAKSLIKQAVEEMGYEVSEDEKVEKRKEALSMFERGEITFEKLLELFKKLK